jgi:2-C-methyl-D-erythritol 4-phosphate cytidylyltransferase
MKKKAEKLKTGAVITAAGASRRMNGTDKVFALISGRPVLSRAIDVFEQCPDVDAIVVVLSPGNLKKGTKLVASENWKKVTNVCAGGERRQDSVLAGLEKLKDCDRVIIHDGARPLVTAELIAAGLEAAEETGAAVAAVPVTDTIKVTGDDMIIEGTPPRVNLWAAQTPQVFRYDLIVRAYREMESDVTDDAAAVERLGGVVKVYLSSRDNIKITTPQDLRIAEILLRDRET